MEMDKENMDYQEIKAEIKSIKSELKEIMNLLEKAHKTEQEEKGGRVSIADDAGNLSLL
jgi:L-lactate utilization protein LutB